jgi:hypothetical protein
MYQQDSQHPQTLLLKSPATDQRQHQILIDRSSCAAACSIRLQDRQCATTDCVTTPADHLLIERVQFMGDATADALCSSAGKGHLAEVQQLLQEGTAVDAVDAGAWTALYRAAGNGHAQVVQLLLGAGARVNDHCDGHTALHWAARGDHTAVVQLLLDAGADVTIASIGGLTCWHDAVVNGHKHTVQLLLAADQQAIRARVRASMAAAGHAELAAMLLGEKAPQAVAAAEVAAAARDVAGQQSLADEVLRLWRAADSTVREHAAAAAAWSLRNPQAAACSCSRCDCICCQCYSGDSHTSVERGRGGSKRSS